jgi:hypothetical protein
MEDRPFLLAGIGAPILKAAGIVAASRAYPGYSHVSQAISELSAQGAPSAATHRTTTAASGLLQLGYAFGLLRRRHKALASMFATIGVAALGGATFRCSPGCPPPGSEGTTRSDTLHNLFGFSGGAALIAAPVVGIGLPTGGPGYRRATVGLAIATVTTGAAALSGIAGSQRGVWQRAFQLCSHTWGIMAAVVLLRRDS